MSVAGSVQKSLGWLLPGLYGIALVQFQFVALLHLGFRQDIAPGLVLALFLLGSFNVPVWDRPVIYVEQPLPRPALQFPAVPIWHPSRQVVALNVGGCILPVLLALLLIRRMDAKCLPSVLLVAVAVGIVARLSSAVHRAGILLMPLPSALCAAALSGLVATPEIAPQIAFCGALWGVLVGADLVRVPRLLNRGLRVIALGGAGMFDGLVVTPLLAAVFA